MSQQAHHGGHKTSIDSLETLQVSLFATNCYVIKVSSGEAAVVDPGGEADRIIKTVQDLGGKLRYILCTHGHMDHIEGAGKVKKACGGSIVLNELDLTLWNSIAQQAEMFGLPAPETLPQPDIKLGGGTASRNEVLPLGSVEIQTSPVPGHSPGSVAYKIPKERIVFNGDTVFAMGVGRTDLEGGNHQVLRNSVLNEIFTLEDDFLLYPGHGPPLSAAEARAMRPLLG